MQKDKCVRCSREVFCGSAIQVNDECKLFLHFTVGSLLRYYALGLRSPTHLRGRSEYAALPVILCSCSRLEEDCELTHQLAGTEFIEKPCSGLLFGKAVLEALNRCGWREKCKGAMA